MAHLVIEILKYITGYNTEQVATITSEKRNTKEQQIPLILNI